MSGLTVTISTVSDEKTFALSQAQTFAPPLLRRFGFPGTHDWASMTTQEREAAVARLAQIALHLCAREARAQLVDEAAAAGSMSAASAYDGTMGTTGDPPS